MDRPILQQQNQIVTGRNAFAEYKVRMSARWQPHQVLDNPIFNWLLGVGYFGASLLPLQTPRKLKLLVCATRRLQTRGMQALARRHLEPWLRPERVEAWRQHQIGWERYRGDFADIRKDPALVTSLLLKEPGPDGEKGVLYCSFESNWMRLIANHDARRLLQEYYLVGASSWSPSDHAVLANLCGLSEDPAFIGISNYSDIAQYKMYAPGIQPLPILASDWVDPQRFRPVEHEKRSIDILMVSHFAHWKRHHLLFTALRKMRKDLRVVLIGRNSDGRTEQSLRSEARAFGVPQELEIYKNLENDEVMQYQCDARVALALSKREGSCVAVTEALFADTPVAMMRDAHIGSRAYINSLTGRILRPAGMARSLSEMIEHSATFTPRAWALEHVAAEITSKKLNDILRQHSLKTGRAWSRDIAPLCWRYVPRYLNGADAVRLRTGVQRLQEEYGITMKEFVSEKEACRKAS